MMQVVAVLVVVAVAVLALVVLALPWLFLRLMWEDLETRVAKTVATAVAASLTAVLVGLPALMVAYPTPSRPCHRWETGYTAVTTMAGTVPITNMIPYEYCAEYGRWSPTPTAGAGR